MSVDSRGIPRGGCEACSCDGYDGGNKQRKCLDCGHPPGKHENLDTRTAATSTRTPPVPGASTLLPAAPTPQASTSVGSAYARVTGFFTKLFASHPAQPHQSTPIDGFKVTPATGRPVEFDANTGREYAYCGEHIGSAAASLPLSGCVQMEQDGDGYEGEWEV